MGPNYFPQTFVLTTAIASDEVITFMVKLILMLFLRFRCDRACKHKWSRASPFRAFPVFSAPISPGRNFVIGVRWHYSIEYNSVPSRAVVHAKCTAESVVTAHACSLNQPTVSCWLPSVPLTHGRPRSLCVPPVSSPE